MALIKCSECGFNVSTKARVCPNCGYPVPVKHEKDIKLSRTVLWFRIALLSVGIIFTIVSIISYSNTWQDYKLLQAQIDRESMGYEWSEAWHTEQYGNLPIPSLTEDYSTPLQEGFVWCGIWTMVMLGGYTGALELDYHKVHKLLMRKKQ